MGKSIKFLIILALTLLFSGIILACAESSTLPHDEDRLMSISVENSNLEIYNDAIALPIIYGHYESGQVEVLPYHELYFEGENTYAFENSLHLKHDAKAEFSETIKIAHQSNKNINTEINIKREFVAADSIQAISYGYKSRLLKNSKWAVDTRFYPSNTTNKAVKYYLDDYAHASIEGNVVTVKSTASFGDTFTVTAVIEEISGKQQRLTSAVRFEVADYIPLYTKEDLTKIEKDGSADYKLMNDIDLGKVDKFGNNWYGIYTLYGTFDGNGHTISNLTMTISGTTPDEQEGFAFFTNNYGTIRNLNFVNAKIKMLKTAQGSTPLIAVIAAVNIGIIENCTVTADFDMRQWAITACIAAASYGKHKTSLAYYAIDNSFVTTIRNCTVKASFYGSTYFGGIVGYSLYSTINNCAVLDTSINSFYKVQQVIGGIAMQSLDSTITNCHIENVEFNFWGVDTLDSYTHVAIGIIVGYSRYSIIDNVTFKNITKNIDMLYLGKIDEFRYYNGLVFQGENGIYGFDEYSTFTNIKEGE